MVVRYHSNKLVIARRLGEGLVFSSSKRVIKNRFFKAPQSESIAAFHPEDLAKTGIPTQSFANIIEKWSAGGFGMISSGMIIVDEIGLGFVPGNLLIDEAFDSEERRVGFERMAAATRGHNTVLIGQVANITDQGAYYQPGADPRASLAKGIYAAKYLADRGFDGIELQVMSVPKKADSEELEMEKAMELIDNMAKFIRKAVGPRSFVLGMKLSTARMQQSGLSENQFYQLVEQLNASGYDFMELAGGSYEHPLDSAKEREEFYRRAVHEAKKFAPKMAIFATGGFRTLPVMEGLVATGKLDGIGLARPSAAEFDLPKRLLTNQVQSSFRSPIEDDMTSGVLAGAAQINQAGKKTLCESNGNVNDGIMDLTDPHILQRFEIAKQKRLSHLEELKAIGKAIGGVVEL